MRRRRHSYSPHAFWQARGLRSDRRRSLSPVDPLELTPCRLVVVWLNPVQADEERLLAVMRHLRYRAPQAVRAFDGNSACRIVIRQVEELSAMATLTRADLARAVGEETGWTQRDARAFVDAAIRGDHGAP